MYFPYLRGRQFELIALRELLENKLIGENVIPLIEPIKPSSTLVKTIGKYILQRKPIAVIHNPQVGNFTEELNGIKEDSQLSEDVKQIYNNEYVMVSHIMNNNSDSQIDSLVETAGGINNLLVINTNSDYIKLYEDIFSSEHPRYVLVPGDLSFRRRIKVNTVLIHDRFEKHKLKRNADYLDKSESLFSEDHLFYLDENYVGFSDYSIVGEDFSEKGFAPYAVAIHIVYFDDEKKLRIKHFTSESNEDISDPAGKFGEALQKLVHWYDTADNVDTHGMREFIRHNQNGTYPGLGTIKKLSIMHHIELVSKYLDEGNSYDLL